ncbi:MAG: STAS domain-containing protein, partial [Ilumatobacter sp.]|uniref:STAS domain-containing protein n=1 Tax=Ilumatobacter sp. TaxID=1967498 RepID=UPI003C718AF7
MMITGELDAYAASLVDEPCSDWLSTGGDAVIDLSNVTLIDAAGTTLVQRLRRAAPGAVRFRDPSRIVRRVFDILSVPIDIPPQADRDSLLAVEP